MLALGHNHPEVVEAVERQLRVLCHGLDFPTELKDEFVSLQLSLLPEEMRDEMKIQFCGPAGANAVDAALKLCKTATGRGEIVAFQGAFHGSTHSAMAVTGLVSQKEPVANDMHGVHFFPYPYPYRSALPLPNGVSAGEACLHYFESVLNDPIGGVPLPAAVIMEIVQAEGGVIPAPTEFVQGVRRVTAELDIPLIVDEIQTGCGRTGTWYAFEQHGIVPDVILASKALGGIGMPIAVVFYDKRARRLGAGRAHRDVPRQPARVRRRCRRREDHRARRDPRERPRAGGVRDRAAAGAREPVRLHRRGARRRPDARHRDHRPGDRRRDPSSRARSSGARSSAD